MAHDGADAPWDIDRLELSVSVSRFRGCKQPPRAPEAAATTNSSPDEGSHEVKARPSPLKKRIKGNARTTATLCLGASTTPAVDLEPQVDAQAAEAEAQDGENGPRIAQRHAEHLAEHRLLSNEPDAALSAAYASTVAAFAASQLAHEWSGRTTFLRSMPQARWPPMRTTPGRPG